MARYSIWNKQDTIYTIAGPAYTPEQWLEKFPWANISRMIIGGGVLNGIVAMEFESTKEMYEKQGCDFSGCETDQDILDAIEVFEDNSSQSVNEEKVSNEELTATSLASIAASLEYQNMMTLEDVEV